MIISRKAALTSLVDKYKKINYRVSKNAQARFREACLLDGHKTFGPVLETLIVQFTDKIKENKIKNLPNIEPGKLDDFSFKCESKTFKAFLGECEHIRYNKNYVLEIIMTSYIEQAEKDHGVSIEA